MATNDRLLVSFSADEFLAISNSLNEVLNNSSVDERDCGARIGIAYSELKELFLNISEAVGSKTHQSTEIFQAWNDGGSVQIRAISVFGDPADLGQDQVRDLILPLIAGSDEVASTS